MKNSNIEWTDLPDYVRRYLDGIDVDAMGKDAADKLLASIDAVATQRATLEQQIYELTTSDAQKLIDTRAKEREAIDASNSTMLDRLYALQDERAATAAAAQAAQEKATLTGARLTREQVCQRLDVHRNTLARYIAERNFPTPGQDGKWLLAEVIDWETRK